MLSELGKVQKQLLRFMGKWIKLKLIIEPGPKIPMGKEIPFQARQLNSKATNGFDIGIGGTGEST